MSAPTITLNNGNKMPVLGLGTWMSAPGEVGQAVKHSIDLGYRHIDCAAVYMNEKEIGSALKEVFDSKKVSREDLFITSKLWNTYHAKEHVREACLNTLKDLQLEYLDLYLIHWPISLKFGGFPLTPNNAIPKNGDGKVEHVLISIQETWQEMEKLVEEGLVKSIGISNFSVSLTKDLLSYAKIVPAVNQIELHPFLPQTDLLNFLEEHNIKVTAYSPLGRAEQTGPLGDEVVKSVATKYNKTPAQILIRWAIDRNTIVIPKSVKNERIEENFNVLDFKLTQEEVDEITKKRADRIVSGLELFQVNIFA